MMGAEEWKHWDVNLAEASWMINIRRSANQPGPAQTKPLHLYSPIHMPIINRS